MPSSNTVNVGLTRWLQCTVQYRVGRAHMLSCTILCMLSAAGRKSLLHPFLQDYRPSPEDAHLLQEYCLEDFDEMEDAPLPPPPDLSDRFHANIRLLEARYDGARLVLCEVF